LEKALSRTARQTGKISNLRLIDTLCFILQILLSFSCIQRGRLATSGHGVFDVSDIDRSGRGARVMTLVARQAEIYFPSDVAFGFDLAYVRGRIE